MTPKITPRDEFNARFTAEVESIKRDHDEKFYAGKHLTPIIFSEEDLKLAGFLFEYFGDELLVSKITKGVEIPYGGLSKVVSIKILSRIMRGSDNDGDCESIMQKLYDFSDYQLAYRKGESFYTANLINIGTVIRDVGAAEPDDRRTLYCEVIINPAFLTLRDMVNKLKREGKSEECKKAEEGEIKYSLSRCGTLESKYTLAVELRKFCWSQFNGKTVSAEELNNIVALLNDKAAALHKEYPQGGRVNVYLSWEYRGERLIVLRIGSALYRLLKANKPIKNVEENGYE